MLERSTIRGSFRVRLSAAQHLVRTGDEGRRQALAESTGMTGELWLEQLTRAVRARVEYVEVSPVDRGTMTFTLGGKGVVVRLAGEGKISVSLSLSGGGTLGEGRIQDRVQSLAISTYALEEATVLTVAEVIAGHLTGEEDAR